MDTDNSSYTKMSELASTEIRDQQTINILICYLLYRINKPVDSEQLYDIAVGTGIINYFFYHDSINYLITNNLIDSEEKDAGTVLYTLTNKGIGCAKTLRKFVKKSYRDKIVQAALRYFARIKYESEVKIEYIKLEKGYYVHCRCLDIGDDLLDMKLFAPDLSQAEMIGKKIMLNPPGFYSKILTCALNNEEEKFDPDEL
ncbi:MAG: DUF4364 family protein [Porcipelethomonas sp.]